MDIKKIERANTIKIGKQIEYYEEISSTHLYAKSIASEKENDGKLIIAEAQTDGIGTNGRNWYTGKGKNIAMTIVLEPNCDISKLDGFTKKIAMWMKQVVWKLYGYDLEIKEPNDLILNGKKICGILTEINTIGEKINYLLISLGMNVNEEYFSKETADIATSLKKEFGKDFSREEIIIGFIEEMEKEIEF